MVKQSSQMSILGHRLLVYFWTLLLIHAGMTQPRMKYLHPAIGCISQHSLIVV